MIACMIEGVALRPAVTDDALVDGGRGRQQYFLRPFGFQFDLRDAEAERLETCDLHPRVRAASVEAAL